MIARSGNNENDDIYEIENQFQSQDDNQYEDLLDDFYIDEVNFEEIENQQRIFDEIARQRQQSDEDAYQESQLTNNNNEIVRYHFPTQKAAIQAAFQEAKMHYVLSDDKPTKVKQPSKPKLLLTQQLNTAYSNSEPEQKKKHHKFFSFFKKEENNTNASSTQLTNASPFSISNAAFQDNYANSNDIAPGEFYDEKAAINRYELSLNMAADDKEARHVICVLLKEQKSLWEKWRGPNTDEKSFTNLFLTALRHHSIEAYRDIIEEKYLKLSPARFQRGKITLYRGDSRSYKTIFQEGFRLQPGSNRSSTPKYLYAQQGSMSTGVSLTRKKGIAKSYAHGNGYFAIELPENHHLLLLKLNSSLQFEVNSMDDIPARYIKFFQPSHGGKQIDNPNFTTNVVASPKIRRGCY